MLPNISQEMFDITGLLPPFSKEASRKILGAPHAEVSATHTYLPRLVSVSEFNEKIMPRLEANLPPEMVKYICHRVSETFRIRKLLIKLRPQIIKIVGEGNFSALWLDREAFSSDSMEHRALVTEAVIHVYSGQSLGKLVSLLYKNSIPMIPYGEGGGYNMGVTPMAPAVTISVRGIDHISGIRPSRRNSGSFEITVGAGVPFKDLQEYLGKRGFVLRCDPNTPRAATGGIVATGSNGGRKIFEVVLEGRAVTGEGSAVRFAVDERENQCINDEPFLMANKFFSINQPDAFASLARREIAKRHPSEILPECRNLTIPLIGMKASANMAAQLHENSILSARSKAQNQRTQDALAESPPLPISAFVGAEGTTGFIYEVTLEIERPKPWIGGMRLHFADVPSAMLVTQKMKGFGVADQPEFFEIITGPSIRRFLVQDFPTVFDGKDEAVLFIGLEGNSDDDCRARVARLLECAKETLATEKLNRDPSNSTADHASPMRIVHLTQIEYQASGRPEFEAMIRPREALPKKLRTKCKTDMEIRTEYLADVLKLVQETKPTHKGMDHDEIRAETKFADTKVADTKIAEDVMFGHLTPRKTAIIHWNIGGFDLYNEESAHQAWDYLENVIGQAQNLSAPGDALPSASFSGEHGIAGKAAFLWLNHLEPKDFERMCQVKDTLDPKGLFNPETLFLRTSISRLLRARLIAFGHKELTNELQKLDLEKANQRSSSQTDEEKKALEFATSEAMRCTRCNSCKICPVIDAEHELRKENPGAYKDSVLPSKRNIIMFLEWVTAIKKKDPSPEVPAALKSMFAEASKLLAKCFYCRKCDKACPVDINIHPMVSAFQKIGKVKGHSSHLFEFLTERLMGEDFFKDYTYKIIGFFTLLGDPVLRLLRSFQWIPDWLKSYMSPPQFALAAYEPTSHGSKAAQTDNFVLISPDRNTTYQARALLQKSEPLQIYIRYRGCMDTYANPIASQAVDTYFKEYLGARFVDLEKKMCCGFPFEADGLHERAARSRFLSLTEIAKCIARVSERTSPAAAGQKILFTVFSNCPTCTEAIKEMRTQLQDENEKERVRLAAKLPEGFDWNLLDFEVRDTAELAVTLLAQLEKEQSAGIDLQKLHALKINLTQSQGVHQKVAKKIGLKVPCHNTPQATAAQIKLLQFHYTDVSAYDRCCGLSGTGRLKYPKIGTKIAEKLFEQIREATPQVVVSGCPSCRDGVVIQRNLLQGRRDRAANFEVAGIFEQILRDS